MKNTVRYVRYSLIVVLFIFSARFASATDVDAQLFQPSFILIKENPSSQTSTIDLFMGPQLVELMENSQQNIDKPTHSYATLQEAVDVVSSIFPGLSGLGIQFISNAALNQLAANDIQLLKNLATNGLHIGIIGSGNLLKEKLSLSAGTPDNSPYAPSTLYDSYFFRLNQQGTIAAVEIRNAESFGAVLTAVLEWVASYKNIDAQVAAPRSSDSPWNSIYYHQWKGNMKDDIQGGSFEGENSGTYLFEVSVYLLNSTDPKNDWYRVDLSSFSNIKSYSANTKECGWFTPSMPFGISISNGGQWWNYMPNTTVNSETKSFTIGGNITSTQAGISAAYSQSYGTSDVEIKVDANPVSEEILWKTSLRGCGSFEWYPFYQKASDAAKSSYAESPSVIIFVPKGENLEFKTHSSADGGNYMKIKHKKFKLKFDVLVIKVFNDEVHTDLKGHFSCTTTSCVNNDFAAESFSVAGE